MVEPGLLHGSTSTEPGALGSSDFWDRGRPARNEREARKDRFPKDYAPDSAFAGGAPAVPANHLTVSAPGFRIGAARLNGND